MAFYFVCFFLKEEPQHFLQNYQLWKHKQKAKIFLSKSNEEVAVDLRDGNGQQKLRKTVNLKIYLIQI